METVETVGIVGTVETVGIAEIVETVATAETATDADRGRHRNIEDQGARAAMLGLRWITIPRRATTETASARTDMLVATVGNASRGIASGKGGETHVAMMTAGDRASRPFSTTVDTEVDEIAREMSTASKPSDAV